MRSNLIATRLAAMALMQSPNIETPREARRPKTIWPAPRQTSYEPVNEITLHNKQVDLKKAVKTFVKKLKEHGFSAYVSKTAAQALYLRQMASHSEAPETPVTPEQVFEEIEGVSLVSLIEQSYNMIVFPDGHAYKIDSSTTPATLTLYRP